MTQDGETEAPQPLSRVLLSPALLSPLVALLGWCGFAWFVLWQGTAGVPVIWTDSASYADVAAHPLWSTGFWAGSRPPLIPLMLKLAGSSSNFVTLQSLIAVFAWGTLAALVGRLVRAGWRRVAAVLLVLAFATSTPIILWNRSVLSESVSLSLVALLVATTLATARTVTWPRVTALVLVALCFAAARDAQVWTVAALGVVVALVAVGRGVRRRRVPRRLAVLAAGLLVAAGSTGWVVFHTGRDRQNVVDVFFVRVFPFPSRVAWFAAHGMPDARAIDAVAARTPAQPGMAKLVNPPFPAVGTWVVNHGQSTYLEWLITHPLDAVTEPLERPERAYNSGNGDLLIYAAPDRVDSPLSGVLWPGWVWLLPLAGVGLVGVGLVGVGLVGVGLVGVGLVGVALERARRDRSGLTLSMLGGLGIVTMLIAWNGDGQEVTRHTVEGFALVRASVLVLAVVGVLRIQPRTQSRPDGATAPAQDRILADNPTVGPRSAR